MRTLLALAAFGLVSVGAGYVLNANADKLPDFMKKANLASAAAVATLVGVPALIAYTLVGGVSHGKLPIPATK